MINLKIIMYAIFKTNPSQKSYYLEGKKPDIYLDGPITMNVYTKTSSDARTKSINAASLVKGKVDSQGHQGTFWGMETVYVLKEL